MFFNKIKKKLIIIFLIIGIISLSFIILVKTKLIYNNENYNVLNTKIKKEDISWNFSIKKESDGFDAPIVNVELQIKDKKYEAGTYEGNCYELNNILLINELSGIECWWKGGGNEIGLFIEDKELVLKKRVVREGDENNYKLSGDFEILSIIETN